MSVLAYDNNPTLVVKHAVGPLHAGALRVQAPHPPPVAPLAACWPPPLGTRPEHNRVIGGFSSEANYLRNTVDHALPSTFCTIRFKDASRAQGVNIAVGC